MQSQSSLSNTNSSSTLLQNFENSSVKAFNGSFINNLDLNQKNSLKEMNKEKQNSNNSHYDKGLNIILSDSEETTDCKRCVQFSVDINSQINKKSNCDCAIKDTSFDDCNENSGTVNLKSWR